jgi:16S rRNA (cytidine1402-2'-O)-methyltransferase
MTAGLYIVGTPIGNLADITYRAVETLRAATVIMAEDTRHTRKLLTHYEISTPCLSCHKFNEARRCETVLHRLRQGETVAMVSDAGMPAISDPGSRVVAAVREAGFPCTVIPGPAAVTSAVALSGLNSTHFYFEGFLPHKSGKRAKRLKHALGIGCPAVFYESPYRLLKLMHEIEEHISADTHVVVCRELTKKFEETTCGTPAEIRAQYENRTVKGELVVIVNPPEKGNQ